MLDPNTSNPAPDPAAPPLPTHYGWYRRCCPKPGRWVVLTGGSSFREAWKSLEDCCGWIRRGERVVLPRGVHPAPVEEAPKP